ncbi:MAG: hypothetical protein MUC75_06685 [Ignavibacteriaceae bacterium]|jgi:hypothetical protein|nr:hypothetical protein [Ignavibacteriaceae bacterium]
MGESILDKAKASLESTKEKIKELQENYFDDEKKEIIEHFKGSGQEKIKETLTTFNQYSSLFKESGYEIGSISASVSIPPDISISFKCLDTVALEKREELLEKAKENKIAMIILISLFKASDFSETLKMGSFKLKTINIKLGLIPGISVTFS